MVARAVHRRNVLRAGLAGCLAALMGGHADEAQAKPRDVARDGASSAEPRLRGAERSTLGTTLDLAPKSAPYPAPGRTWSDPTVLVFVPRGFRVPTSGAVDALVFFHGHGSTAREAIRRHQLREQLAESLQNAILVVPQGPIHAADGDFGHLMERGGLARLLDEVRVVASSKSAARALPDGGLGKAKGTGRVVVAGHSGGYRAAAAAITVGGVEVRETWLFDALYGETETFAKWLVAAPRTRKLVSLAIAGEPLRHNHQLLDLLQAKGIAVSLDLPTARLSRAEMVHARAILGQQIATHGTATFEESSLRDCLLASCLKGRGSDAFFEDADAPRLIDRRGVPAPRTPS